MKNLIILFTLLFSTNAFAVAYTSSNSGNWSDIATWGGVGFPMSGDTATISVGDIIEVDGNITIGRAPTNNYTYDLVINGTLNWTGSPTSDWTFTSRSSVRVNAGGYIKIGMDTPFGCARTAEWVFENSTSSQQYLFHLYKGVIQVHGCENYTNSSSTVTRAKIASCSPDCTAGAGKTITLDRDVNWNASNGWVGDNIFFGVGGSVSNPPAAIDDAEYITSWTIGSANSITGVTFTENHQIGDLVENGSRNVVLRSDSITYPAKMYTYSTAVDNMFYLKYMLLKYFGGYAIQSGSGNYNFGSMTHSVLIGTTLAGIYIATDLLTAFSDNIVYSGGRAYSLNVASNFTFNNLSCYNSSETCIYSFSRDYGLTYTNLWASDINTGVLAVKQSGGVSVISALIHKPNAVGIHTQYESNTQVNRIFSLVNSELRNSMAGVLARLQYGNIYLRGNDFDTAFYSCLTLYHDSTRSMVRAYKNTYDNCNTSNTISMGALEIESAGSQYFGFAEEFGQTTPNYQQNILFTPAGIYNYDMNKLNLHFDNYKLATPTNPFTCMGIPNMLAYPLTCAADKWASVEIMKEHSYVAFSNINQVEDEHYGIGPGGMTFSQEKVIILDESIALKMTPVNAFSYSWFVVGKTYVSSGDALAVSIDLRKDEAITETGRRPRLGLIGCGFDREIHYDEMSDVTDTWETVTVSGTATATNVVYIYIGIKNTLSGVNVYEPTWPPTLDVYADKIVVTK